MILYYTHNAKPAKFTRRVWDTHAAQAERTGQHFKSIVRDPSLYPSEFRGAIKPFDAQPLYADLFGRILRGLEFVQDDEPIYLAEDDTLYPDERYSCEPIPGMLGYNLNIVYLGAGGYVRIRPNTLALSQLYAFAGDLRKHVEGKLGQIMTGKPCEHVELVGPVFPIALDVPSVDFRTRWNATWKLETTKLEWGGYFQELNGWPTAAEMWKRYMGD
jgi:hypothetical protein